MSGDHQGRWSRGLLHLAIWGAALGLYFLLPFGLASVMALDFEALLFNLAEGMEARVDRQSLVAGVALLTWGSLPLFLLAAARLLYLPFGRLWGLSNPLLDLPWWARCLVGLPALASFGAFTLPCSRALSVWLSLEAFWWIQWYENIPPVMDAIRENTPYLAVPALLISGSLVLWLSLRARGVGPGPGRALRLLRRGLVLLALLVAVALTGVAGVHGSRVVGVSGRNTFERKCGQCHLRSRPLFYLKTSAEWRRAVKRMRRLERAPVSAEEAQDVTAFLTGMRSFSDRWTFRTRCQRCHGLGTWRWEDRPAADWARITERMARWSPYYYRRSIRQQVNAHLARAHSDEGATFGLPLARYQSYLRVEKTCAPCHSLTWGADRVRPMDSGAVLGLVRRMKAKSSSGPAEAGEGDLARTYHELIKGKELLKRLFPHDMPLRDGGPPW